MLLVKAHKTQILRIRFISEFLILSWLRTKLRIAPVESLEYTLQLMAWSKTAQLSLLSFTPYLAEQNNRTNESLE